MNPTALFRRHFSWIGSLLALSLFAGCGAPMANAARAISEIPPGTEEEVAAIKADPMAYLRQSLADASKIRTAKIKFQRQERLGLVPELRPVEHMDTEFREEPFSVRFTWTNKDSTYLQAVFVKGQNNDRVQLLPRRGLLGLKPSIANYPVDFAVTFQQSKKPVTDFGPRLMLERLFDRIEKAKPFGGTKIQYIGTASVGPGDELCHHIELLFPAGDEFPCKLIDLYVNQETRLPVAVYLWLTEEKRERTPKTLDAMYVYGEMTPNPALSDDNFVIESLEKLKGTDHADDDAPAAKASTETAKAK